MKKRGGLAIREEEITGNTQISRGIDPIFYVVALFLLEGNVGFIALQRTVVTSWRPGIGVHIKYLEANLFLFEFYHKVDVKRVVKGCPCSFNRIALVMTRLKEGEYSRCVELNTTDL